MKKLIATLLSVVMIFGMSVTVFANPGQNPNFNPGVYYTYIDGVRVEVFEGGANLRFYVGGVPQVRAGNGTFNQRITINGNCYYVSVGGNSIVGWTLIIPDNPGGEPAEVWTRIGTPTVILPTGLNVFRHHQHSRYGRQNNSVFGSIVISVVYSSNLPTSPDRTVTYTHNFDFWFGQGTSSARVNFPGHVFTYENPNGADASLVINPFSVNAVIQNQGQRQTVNICCRRYEIIPRSSVTVTQ